METRLQTLASKPASHDGMHFVDFMPDSSFLPVCNGNPDRDLACSLVRNKMHTNVAFLLDEEKRREPEIDTLTVYRGLLGSYPNFMVLEHDMFFLSDPSGNLLEFKYYHHRSAIFGETGITVVGER